MPRRRGAYTLTKSTSFTVFPITNSSDKVFYSANNTDQGTYKAKTCLNVTIAPDNCATFINDTNKEEQQTSLSSVKQSYQMQQTNKTRNGYRRELFQLFEEKTRNGYHEFFRDFSNNNFIPEEHNKHARNRRQYRTISHDSSFRNSLKYSFEKMKLRAASQKYTKQETKPFGEIISVMNLMPGMLTAMKRANLSGKNSRKKSRKVHRSKSGAPKIMHSSIAKNGHYVEVLLSSN
ncbi:unnamed protein product [Acanthocheilonema viteae]|uniref:Uncharacterized protein n=1 Tax=Acanthocheilonema viteae TaxID=6277 RepID=A0A498SK61_ACAVI|nr:unnamed protein product [Acanthocheilonema viteae]